MRNSGRRSFLKAAGAAAVGSVLPAAARDAGNSPGAPKAAPRQDLWRVIGPGGGGAQFIPSVSPHDPRLVFVGCDMTGGYVSHDGGDTWRMFSLHAPPRFFVFDPIDPRTVYTQTVALFRSRDSGGQWEMVYPQPGECKRVVVNGDHGQVRLMTSDGPAPQVVALAIDPESPAVLFAAVAAGANTELHESRDSGATWRKTGELASRPLKLVVDPRSPGRDRTLWAVASDSVLVREAGSWKQRSRGAGAKPFTEVSHGFAEGGLILYAVDGSALFLSRDAGATWSQAGPSKVRFRSVAASERNPHVAYASFAGLRDEAGAQYFGVMKTADGGGTWETVWKESQTPGTNIHDAWLSKAFGPGWSGPPFALGVAPSQPDVCFGTDFGRTMRTRDGGRAWHGVYSRELNGAYTTTGLDVTTCYGVHFDPFDRKRMLISYTDIGPFASEDGGTTWSSVAAGIPRQWVNTAYWIEFDPAVKGRAWMVSSGTHDLPRPKMWRRSGVAGYRGGVLVSDDGGRRWRVASESLPQTAATHILLDPDSPPSKRTLYIAAFGRGVFKSVDGGATWVLKNQGIEGAEPFAWRLARDPKGLLYLVVARRADETNASAGDGALYRSKNAGETWERMSLPAGVNGPNGLAIDPEQPSRLYLAAWGRYAPEGPAGGGIYVSEDAGATWRVSLGRDQYVYDVTLDPKDPRTLYACGFESSAWRSTDRGRNWKRMRGFNFKWGHRVIPDPYRSGQVYVTTFGGSLWYGPAEGDRSAAEDIKAGPLAHGGKN